MTGLNDTDIRLNSEWQLTQATDGDAPPTNTQALVGCVLFHLMFILAPAAGKNLFGDAAIGE